MYAVITIFLIGFLAFVIMSIGCYRGEARDYLPKILPENKREAKKYMLIKSLLFVLSPEIAMIGMAILPFSGIDIMDPRILFKVAATFAIIAILSMGFSDIYGKKARSFIPKESGGASAT